MRIAASGHFLSAIRSPAFYSIFGGNLLPILK